MKLWHLKRRKDSRMTYDEAISFVIRATTEKDARLLAATRCGDEGERFWLDGRRSRCEELTADGGSEMICRDFHHG